MFHFIKEHSYDIFKLFLTQIAIAILGLVLSFSTSSNSMLFFVSSLFAAFFYICLLYSEGWELGAKDRPRITNGRLKFDPIKGARLSLFSNSLNFVLVLVLFVQDPEPVLVPSARCMPSSGIYSAPLAPCSWVLTHISLP